MVDRAGTQLAAVLFDMDGTLIDSEKLWTFALDDVAEELGGRLSAETRVAMIGRDLVGSVQLLIDDVGVDAEIPVVQRLLVGAVAHYFESSIEWRPGAQELLTQVRDQNVATALVTSTHRNLTAIALETIGAQNFDVIICGDEVQRTKPDPQPYLQALRDLGVTAQQAVAIEDSVSGSTAAAAAGIATLVTPSEVSVPPGERLTIIESLVGVDVTALRGLLSTTY